MNRVSLNELNNNAAITFDERPGIDFEISKEIGRGASCIVYHAVGSDNTEHLLKEYYPKHLELIRDSSGQFVVPANKRETFDQGLVRFRAGCERQKNIRLSNEGLKNFTCNVQGYYAANGTEYIDMTCFSGKTYDRVHEKSVYNLMLRMRTLTQVVGNYHKAGLLHLDIKPENIYVRPEDETVEDVMLFDFDSVTPMNEIITSKALSCTKTWAAPEQLLPEKRKCICSATDLFAIGEIIFVQLFGRHSSAAERRSFMTKYNYDYGAEIFKSMNPRVFPILDELLGHTICGVVDKRYQTAEQLIETLDRIIKLADPKEPYIGKHLPAVQDFFIGRDAEMEEIHTLFSDNRIVFLNGIGGIGKSELAKRYAHKHKDDYDSILFAPYVSDVNMLITDDAAVQISNFAPYPEEKPEDYCTRKLRKLKDLCDERTLIIVDNLDHMDDPDLNKLLDLNCKLLITTRADFSEYGYGKQLELDVLADRTHITELFEKYYTKLLTDEEDAFVSEIIDIVGGHTMTVELLAKQMMAGRVKPEKMLAKLKEGGLGESGKEMVRSGKDGKLSAQSTYAHLQTLFDLSDLTEQEIYVLANLSLIPYTGISTELFHDWCELEDYDTINSLVAEGWIREDEEKDYIYLHPVVGDMVLNNISDNTVFEVFVKSYISHLRERDFAEGAIFQKHCEDSRFNINFLNLIKRYSFKNPFFELLLNEIGGKLFIIHQYDTALQACELATKIATENHPAQSYAVMESLSQMALVKAAIGAERKDRALISEAVNTYLQAIENHKTFDETEYPDNYEEIATLYNYAGMAYEDLDEIDRARDMYSEGIAVYTERTVLSADDYLSLGILYNNLGNTYSGSEALKYYLVARENHEKSGKLTRHAAITYYHLADAYSCADGSDGDLILAIDCAQRSLDFFLNEYSEDLYMIGETKYMLGKVYSQFADLQHKHSAYVLLNEAEKIFVQFLPPEDNTLIKVRELNEQVCKQITLS